MHTRNDNRTFCRAAQGESLPVSSIHTHQGNERSVVVPLRPSYCRLKHARLIHCYNALVFRSSLYAGHHFLACLSITATAMPARITSVRENRRLRRSFL
jgi:hypothetical protein